MANLKKRIAKQEIITIKRMVDLFKKRIETEKNEKNKKIFAEQLETAKKRLYLLEQK